jgi:hypothetical protein
MFGHGCLPEEPGGLEPDGAPDWDGPVGVVVVLDGVVVAGAVLVELVLPALVLAPVVPVPLDAAEAPEMPAIAPPLASAPATIVAPSILDTFIGLTSWWCSRDLCVRSIVHQPAKRTRRDV